MESEGSYYQDMDRLAAMEKGLRTWADWVDKNIDVTRTRVFFQAISPTHYKLVSLSLSFSLSLLLGSIIECWLGLANGSKHQKFFAHAHLASCLLLVVPLDLIDILDSF